MGKLGAIIVAALVFAGCSGGNSVTDAGNGNTGNDAGSNDGGTITPPVSDAGTDGGIPIPPDPDGGTTTTPPSDAGTPGMTPGSLGAGPWPTTNVTYGANDGIQETPVVGITTDETQNIWVATQSALYLMRPGDTHFTRFDASAGLHLPGNPTPTCFDSSSSTKTGSTTDCSTAAASNPGISEITGGGPNEVFVGYWGQHIDGLGNLENSGNPSLPDGTPVDGTMFDPARHTGKLDRVRLTPASKAIEVVRFDVLSSDDKSFWHNRDVERMIYDHFIHRHELFVGMDHGVDRLRPDLWSEPTSWFLADYQPWLNDHLHAQVCLHTACEGNPSATQMLGDWRGLTLDQNGDLWTGGRWAAGQIHWTAGDDWFRTTRSDGTKAFGSAFGDGYTSADCGRSDSPVFCPPQEGDPVNISAVTETPDGKIWFASGTLFSQSNDVPYGIAYWNGHTFTYFSSASVGLGEADVRDMVALPDGRLVIAGISTGLVIFNPANNTHVNIHQGQGIPSDRIYRLELDTMVSPPVLHVATANGAASIRVFPQ